MTIARKFEWKEPSTWTDSLLEVIPPKLLSRLVAKVCCHKNDFAYLDDVLAFRDVYSKIGDYLQLAERLPVFLQEAFTFIRMFHCCRPVDAKSYYQDGIRVLTPTETDMRFKKIFLGNPRLPLMTEAHIDTAIELAAKSYGREGRIYFGLDKGFLIKRCGHYLIYGSEYFQCLAGHIESRTGQPVKAELTKIGTPTIFKIDLPIEYVSDQDLCELGEAALHAWAYRIVHPNAAIRDMNYAVNINHDLTSDLIKGHYHPECIPDPLQYQRLYRYKTAQS